MPKRTNTFQEVVSIIHTHLAGDATVEESAMLENRLTGELREVDTVIRTKVAGVKTTIGIESISWKRRADGPWVEKMHGKHVNLPTDKVVLVSESGFTKPARALAERENMLPLAPEDLTDDDPVGKIANALPSLWPKVITLTAEGARVWVDYPKGETSWFEAPADLFLLTESGEVAYTLVDYFGAVCTGNWNRIHEQIGTASIEKDTESNFFIEVGPPVEGKPADEVVPLFVRYDDGPDGPELHSMERVRFDGKAVIRVSRIDLKHMRLGDSIVAYGEGMFDGKPALLVATEDGESGTLTIRTSDESESG